MPNKARATNPQRYNGNSRLNRFFSDCVQLVAVLSGVGLLFPPPLALLQDRLQSLEGDSAVCGEEQLLLFLHEALVHALLVAGGLVLEAVALVQPADGIAWREKPEVIALWNGIEGSGQIPKSEFHHRYGVCHGSIIGMLWSPPWVWPSPWQVLSHDRNAKGASDPIILARPKVLALKEKKKKVHF